MDNTTSNTTSPGTYGSAGATTNPAGATTTGSTTAGSMTTGTTGGQSGYGTQNETSPYREEARSRFNAALEEAKAGAAALKEEAKSRASSYRDQARGKSENWSSEARSSASGLAVEGKAKASGALMGLSRVVEENASKLEENLGPQYGDYARSASRSIRETAEKLEQRSVEELSEDVRTFVREQPATAVGLAALAGFLVARVFRK